MFTETDKSKLAANAEKAELLLKLVANKYRLMVLCSLINGEKSVSDLENAVNLSQSALSQHLAKLRAANIVDFRKEGKSVRYRIISVEATALLSTLYLIFCNN
ncbi:MAG: metalloregulator ArsR/SmtB family transcription factor [Pseudomonadota bacterium]